MGSSRASALGAAGLALALGIAACSSDLFHSTEWSSRCDSDPGARECTAGSTSSSGATTSTGAGGEGGSGTAAAVACADYAEGICEAVGRCFPILYATTWGDDATCIPAQQGACERQLFGPGSTFDPDDLLTCTASLEFADITCPDLYRYTSSQSSPPTCAEPGTLTTGSVCIEGHQCEGSACEVALSAACGLCVDAKLLGGACDTAAECSVGLRCSGGICVTWKDLGDPCTTSSDCYADLTCAAGVCAPRLAGGATCSPTLQDCVVEHLCNTVTSICEPYGIAPFDAACGLTAAGGYTVCAVDTACQITDEAANTGICIAVAEVGEPCQFDSGPSGTQCRHPARCVAGTCYLKDASVCGDL